jgi:uncharacterized protein YbcV (DUF1398 family)
MFTLQQMKAAHAKVKSGADFPAYVQEIKQQGLVHYDFMVKDGRTVYHGADDFQVSGDPFYPEKIISDKPSPDAVRQIIAEHQQGKSDFLTFCSLVAAAGVEKWVVDTRAMLCTYYDLSGNNLVAEPIPDGDYR